MAYQYRLEMNLLQLFGQQENSEWLSIISLIFLRSTLLMNRNKNIIGNDLFCCLYVSIAHNSFTASPLPHRCAGVPVHQTPQSHLNLPRHVKAQIYLFICLDTNNPTTEAYVGHWRSVTSGSMFKNHCSPAVDSARKVRLWEKGKLNLWDSALYLQENIWNCKHGLPQGRRFPDTK